MTTVGEKKDKGNISLVCYVVENKVQYVPYIREESEGKKLM
jgi:hypothetical protein